MFQTACWATRVYWDIFAGEQLKKKEPEVESVPETDEAAFEGMEKALEKAVEALEKKKVEAEKAAKRKEDVGNEFKKWIKWVSLLGAMRQKLDKVTTARGLTQLPDFILAPLMEKKPGDFIFWAAMSSTTLDTAIAESYANQCRPCYKNVLFTINNITEGLVLHSISLYPKEREILLPPLTMLKVTEVTPPVQDAENPENNRPGRIVVDFAECLITPQLQDAVERDLQGTTDRLQILADEAKAAKQEEAKKAWEATKDKAKACRKLNLGKVAPRSV
jgi:hypothetical protein